MHSGSRRWAGRSHFEGPSYFSKISITEAIIKSDHTRLKVHECDSPNDRHALLIFTVQHVKHVQASVAEAQVVTHVSLGANTSPRNA